MNRILLLSGLAASLLCSNLQAQSGWDYFDGNNVEALISPVANHFWDYNSSQYFIPKDSNTTSLFTSTIWIGGLDDNGDLHLSAERFRQTGYDYTPGPVSDPSAYNPPTNGSWDNVWKIDRSDLDSWLGNPYNTPIPNSVMDWPGNGNTSLGQAQQLAPFGDADGDGQYNPQDFDHPIIKGDQAVYFIFNDDATLNTESGGQKMGVEIHGMAYGFNCPEDTALDNALFMEYTIINRSSNDYHDVYVGLWNDIDLGNAQDDYVGSDPLRNLFFAYNGDQEDEDLQGKEGFGVNLPAQGIRLLKGPKLDDNGIDDQPDLSFTGNYNGFGMGDGVIDNEEAGLYSIMYHNNDQGPTGDPSNAQAHYNYMRATWLDGTPLTFGGTGYAPGDPNATPSRFMFPDSTDTLNFSTGGITPNPSSNPWTEVTAGNPPGDRRIIGSVGPFNLSAHNENQANPNSTKTFTIVYVFAQKMNDRLGAVEKMKAYSDHLQDVFDSGVTACGEFQTDYFPLPALSVEEAETKSSIGVFPNPSQGQFAIQSDVVNATYTLQSMSGQIVKTGVIRSANELVNTSDLDAGVYMLDVESANAHFMEKVVLR